MEHKRILIVDDDRNIQRMLRVCLEGSGYDIEQATDGAMALEAISAHAPDLMLLDLAMPVIDGMTVLADLRQMLPTSPVRVIVMTAHGAVRTAMQAVRLGASDFLEKPFKPEELRQSVASVLQDSEPHAHDAGGYAEALQSVRDALRRGKFIAAEAALMKAGVISDSDPCFLNLAGLLHEAHGRVSSARTFFRKALSSDPNYTPARQNLARLDELEQRGATRLELALGDEVQPTAFVSDSRASASTADRIQQLLQRGESPARGLKDKPRAQYH